MNRIGKTVGHIRLEALLGAGGMGEVYRGFDAKLQRHVAVKTIRAEHRLSAEMKARFLREARILSKLAHPAICQVYDLQESADEDFLIFELAEGVTLGELARGETLDETRILELGSRIADALGVAHREQIVHRDLKPHNVMVAPGGAIKLLDFGLSFPGTSLDGESLPAFREPPSSVIAHPVDGASTVRIAGAGADPGLPTGSTLTPHGTVVGTIHYMSPEQARGHEMGPPSDLFSLGIVLQELLTGRRAYPEGSGIELLQMVAFHESLPIQGVDPEVGRLVEDLKHPNPARRPTAGETAERLRWLLERPQRLRRRRLRLRLAVAAFVALALVLALVSGLAYTAVQARERAENEAARANREATTANQVLGFVVDLFGEADVFEARGDLEPRSAADLVEQGILQIRDSLADQPAARARLQGTLGSLAVVLGRPADAVALLEESLAAMELEGRQGPELVPTLNDLGTAYWLDGRDAKARLVLLRAKALLDADLEPRLEQRADNSRGLGLVASDPAEAAEHLRVSLEYLGRNPRTQPQEVFDALSNLAIRTTGLGRFEEAESLFRRALALHESNHFPENANLAQLLNNFGIHNRNLGRYDEAEKCYLRAIAIGEKTLGPDHLSIASMLDSLARLLNRQGRPAEAVPLLQRSLGILEKRVGLDHVEAGVARVRLADARRLLGEPGAAARELERGVVVLEAELGADDLRQVEAQVVRALLQADRGEAPAARATFEAALALARDLQGADHPETRLIERQLARLSASLPRPPSPSPPG